METKCKCGHSIYDHYDDTGCDARGCACSIGFEDAVDALLNEWEARIKYLEAELEKYQKG